MDDNVWKQVSVGACLFEVVILRTIDCRHDESDLRRVRGTREMSVDLLRLVLVEVDKAVEDVVASRFVICAA